MSDLMEPLTLRQKFCAFGMAVLDETDDKIVMDHTACEGQKTQAVVLAVNVRENDSIAIMNLRERLTTTLREWQADIKEPQSDAGTS